MKRLLGAALALLLLGLAIMAAAGATDAAAPEPPVITGAGVFLERPGGAPTEIGYDTDHRLDTAVPPGSALYFLIDNARINSQLAGYSAYVYCDRSEDSVDLSPQIRYVELFDAGGQSIGYRFAARVAFYEASYEQPPEVVAYVRVGTRSTRQNTFKFIATLQEGPLDAQISHINCVPDTGLLVFAPDYAYTELIFGETGRFFVRTMRQRPLDLSYSTETVLHRWLTARYPEGVFYSIGFEAGPVFDNMGQLLLRAPDSFYLYEHTPAGLRALSFVYDEGEGGFVVATRRLGDYLLSSISLSEDALTGFKTNPPTGVAAEERPAAEWGRGRAEA